MRFTAASILRIDVLFLCSNSFGSTESEYEDYSTTATNDLSTVLSSTKFRSRLVLLVDKKLN